MRIDCRDPDWRFDENVAVIDCDTGFMIEQVVAVDDEEGWILVNLCDRDGCLVMDMGVGVGETVKIKLNRPVRIVDLSTVPRDQRRGVINLTRPY